MNFKVKKTSIPDVIIIEPTVYSDNRGVFFEISKQTDFRSIGIPDFVQCNQSVSKKGVLRGLHVQSGEHAQGKYVRCIKGEIFDVAVDMRPDSPTYLSWISENLSETNRLGLYIPPGFAHGFYVLSDIAEVIYSCTKEYSPIHEYGVSWDEPKIGIKWPTSNPILSEKDRLSKPL